MPLTREEVLRLADIYHIQLSEEEVAQMQTQMSSILEQFQSLSQLDTDGVEPTGHAVSLDTIMRRDVPVPSYPQESILSNAPDKQGEFFQVHTVLED
jgi:aspartyl-tRNA(Asn)/glutamyl-tRNA(Gln) amidotransferase subunit C